VKSSDATAPEHVSLEMPVTAQKYSPSHMTTGDEQAQRGSIAVFRSGIGNGPPTRLDINRWYRCHLADSRARFAVFCTPTPRMWFPNANEIPKWHRLGAIRK